MKLSFKYFNISSIKAKIMCKYSDKEFIFNNHLKDFVRGKEVINSLKKYFKEIQKMKFEEFEKQNKKHRKEKTSNSEVESVLLVLMHYGYSKDYIINKIFDGYCNSHINTENEVKEKFLVNAKIFKDSFHNTKITAPERIIMLYKNKIMFPLFVDVNHSLYIEGPIKVISKDKIESFFKEIFLKN